jgi:polysaccharide biosynthesis transport protein
MPEFTGQNDLRSYLRVLWRWKYLIVLLVVAAPAVTWVLEHGKPKIYQSSTLVGISSETVNSSLLSGSGGFSTSNISVIARLVTTPRFADVAGALMKPPTSGASIVGGVSASGDPTTNLITITTTENSPTRAAAIANAFAQALVNNQQQSAINAIKASIKGIKSELSHLSRTNANYGTLSQQLQQLQASLSTQSSQASILQSATPNDTPIGPHLRRSLELGFVIGLLLAFAVVMIAESADRRMRSPDDLASLTDLTMLAAIPPHAFSGDLQSRPEDEEVFQMLRTSLTYFGDSANRIRSVMITSPGEKEGKSTVAAKLALASAKAGLDVALIDADLRRGGASAQFGIQAQRGLGALLESRSPVESALFEWPLEGPSHGRLRIVPAGPPPANPSALMSSDHMRTVISSLQAQSDLVIVDTPAALAVSDSVPLMRAVNGVVLVARMNHSSRETIHRLQGIIESAHGNLLGVVATGVQSGPGYEKYSQSYYGPGTPEPKRRRGRKTASQRPASGGVRLVPPESQAQPIAVPSPVATQPSAATPVVADPGNGTATQE